MHTYDEDHKANLVKIAVNNNSERPFGAFTGQLQSYGFLRLQHASGMAQTRVNGDFNRGKTTLITGKNRF